MYFLTFRQLVNWELLYAMFQVMELKKWLIQHYA